MMLRTIKEAWREHAFSSAIVDEFLSMIGNSEEMLSYALKTLVNRGAGSKKEEKIYAKDRSIGLTERDIRRKILEHLGSNPGGNLPACLMLINAAKDAERIGEHARELIELLDIPDAISEDNSLFINLFDTIGARLLTLVGEVRISFRDEDFDRATEAVKLAYEIAGECEDVIRETTDSSIGANHAVVLTLGSRYMKRIACHLSNIASSVTNPLTDIDYHVTETTAAR